MAKSSTYDVVVIGGGFYGCMIAIFLRKYYKNILVIEREKDILLRASYNNQARVHNGYHYPRSFITALRSHANFGRFVDEFESAIYDKFLMTYPIAANSKVTASQFYKFIKQVGSPIKTAPDSVKSLFNSRLIEEVFVVEEYAFNASILRETVRKEMGRLGIDILCKIDVLKVSKSDKGLTVQLQNKKQFDVKEVFNCAYSGINRILANSNLSLLPFKHELTEMPLVKMPKGLENLGLTIMDGPFFSIMPFPDKKLHSLHHVRYTPHRSWIDNESGKNNYSSLSKKPHSKFLYIYKDIQRYIPAMKDLEYKGAIWEVKTILMRDEVNDRRPILFRNNYELPGFHVVMGGKIDNIYDIFDELEQNYASSSNPIHI